MAATRVQRATSGGQVVAVGFGSGTISCMIRASQNNAGTGNVEYIPDENGDDCIAVVSNLGERLTAEGALLTGQTTPKKGDIVTIDSTKYIVEECGKNLGPTVTRVSMTLYANTANTWAAAS